MKEIWTLKSGCSLKSPIPAIYMSREGNRAVEWEHTFISGRPPDLNQEISRYTNTQQDHKKKKKRKKNLKCQVTCHVKGKATTVWLVEEVKGSPGVLQVLALLGAPPGALLLDLLHGGYLVQLLFCNHNSAQSLALVISINAIHRDDLCGTFKVPLLPTADWSQVNWV